MDGRDRQAQPQGKAVVGRRQIAGTVDNHAAQRMRSRAGIRSEEHTSELQSLKRISYAVLRLTKNTRPYYVHHTTSTAILRYIIFQSHTLYHQSTIRNTHTLYYFHT